MCPDTEAGVERLTTSTNEFVAGRVAAAHSAAVDPALLRTSSGADCWPGPAAFPYAPTDWPRG